MELIDFRQTKTSELVRREYYAFNVPGVYDKSKNYTSTTVDALKELLLKSYNFCSLPKVQILKLDGPKTSVK